MIFIRHQGREALEHLFMLNICLKNNNKRKKLSKFNHDNSVLAIMHLDSFFGIIENELTGYGYSSN